MTIILKTDQLNPDPGVLRKAADVIRRGGTVVFPTETVYGLGANALSSEACSGIFRAKNRPEDNPLIVHVSSFEQLAECTVDPDEKVLGALEKIWPGPLTVLMRRSGVIPDNVTAGLDTVAIRMPANPLALKLIELSGVPIAAPSANIATRPSIVDSSEAIGELEGRVDVIIDAGPTFFGMESTIINTMKRPVELMRPGSFDQDELEQFFGKIVIGDVARGTGQSDTAITPGMKYKHYAPETRMFMIDQPEILGARMEDVLSQCTLLMSAEALSRAGVEGISLGTEADLYTIAKNLFSSFRELERRGSKYGIIQTFPESGIGLAIMNRIRKASSGYIRNRKELDRLLDRN